MNLVKIVRCLEKKFVRILICLPPHSVQTLFILPNLIEKSSLRLFLSLVGVHVRACVCVCVFYIERICLSFSFSLSDCVRIVLLRMKDQTTQQANKKHISHIECFGKEFRLEKEIDFLLRRINCIDIFYDEW